MAEIACPVHDEGRHTDYGEYAPDVNLPIHPAERNSRAWARPQASILREPALEGFVSETGRRKRLETGFETRCRTPLPPQAL
jgi:hypothetical protein